MINLLVGIARVNVAQINALLMEFIGFETNEFTLKFV